MKIIDRKTLWEGRFLQAVLIGYETHCNSSSTVEARHWESFRRVNCEGVVGIVPITPRGEVVLIRQYRPPVDRYVIELPAGLIDRDESATDAAHRELKEETGYVAEDMLFLTSGPMSSGASSEILDVYVATGLQYVGVGDRDETENIEVLIVPCDTLAEELRKKEVGGDFVDLKVYGLTVMAREFLAGHTFRSREESDK